MTIKPIVTAIDLHTGHTSEPILIKHGTVTVLDHTTRPSCPIAHQIDNPSVNNTSNNIKCSHINNNCKSVDSKRISLHYKSKRPSTSVDISHSKLYNKESVHTSHTTTTHSSFRAIKSYSDISRHRRQPVWIASDISSNTNKTRYSYELKHIDDDDDEHNLTYLSSSLPDRYFYSICD